LTDRILKLLQEFDAFAVMLFDDIMTGTFGDLLRYVWMILHRRAFVF